MIFKETPLFGAYIIELDKKHDARGFFSRLFCMKEFQKRGLDFSCVQVNSSSSTFKGTLRGLHYQIPPKEESKLISCIKGSFYDVVLDLRQGSKTFGKSFGTVLNNRSMVLVPKGCAHGYLTLEDNTEAFYLTSEFYDPELERGVRWDDPQFQIEWPIKPVVISEKDKTHPNYYL